MPIVADTTYQIRWIWRHTESQNAVLQKYFRVLSHTGVDPTFKEIGDQIELIMLPLFQACIASAWSYQGYKIREVYPTPSQLLPRPHVPQGGSLIGESLPTQVASVLSMRASTAPPKSRGRLYFPSPDEASSGSGVPLLALQNAINAVGARLLQDFTATAEAGGSCVLACGIWQPKFQVKFYRFDVAAARKKFGTQRRRSAINRADAFEF